MMGRNGENNKKKRSFTSLSSSASAASSSSTSTAKENDDKVTPSSEPAAPAVSTPSESHQSAAEQGEPQEQPVQPVQPKEQLEIPEIPLLYLEEGLFAVNKPLGWTSQDVVGKIRNILEQDAKSRNVPDPRKKKRKPWMKVGHGGTLDPLATGVLVIGVGKGTKSLQKYLVGPKGYKAEITLGYQTSTLDTEITGSIVQRKSYDHVTSYNQINNVLQTKFVGKIQQVPPIFSALKRDGKKLYQLAREDGLTADDIQIDSREVIIYKLELDDDDCSRLLLKEEESQENNDSDTNINTKPIKKFSINVECGGGTYIRSLVRDIGIELGTCATMTKLERTKQGYFNKQEHCIQYQINDKNNDGNIDDYSPSNNNNNNNNAGHDDDDTTTPTEIKTSNEKDNNEEQKGENANANANAKANSNATTNTNTNTNTNRIDKRKECNWTVETITDAIISSRERLLLLDDNDNNNDGLDNDNDNSRL
jgi:tRNA pseudouridine55 synthase